MFVKDGSLLTSCKPFRRIVYPGDSFLSRARSPFVVRAVRATYLTFELLAFAILAVAALMALYDLVIYIKEHGFIYNEVLARILLIFVFIDLMRVIVHSVAERRFRMDILFEAITIAIARDLISSLAMIEESLATERTVALAGLLSLAVGLWYLARRIELCTTARGSSPSERD
jgi:uncharacterized membrane protein (DUF373 family)